MTFLTYNPEEPENEWDFSDEVDEPFYLEATC